jgi:hypothetical protein
VTVLADTLGFFSIEQDLPSRCGSSRHLQTDNLNRLDFSKRRNDNLFQFHTGVVLHNIIEWIYFYSMIFSQKEMGSKKHTAEVVLPNMIERIYF